MVSLVIGRRLPTRRPTGLHRNRFYPEGHWRFSRSPEALADLFVDEIERGVDANDCAGPDVRRRET